MNDEITQKTEEKTKIVEILENIDITKDPIAYIFWKHLQHALLSFSNTSISHEDAYNRYEKLTKLGCKYLLYGMSKENSEAKKIEDIDEAIKTICNVLLERKRVIKLSSFVI